MKRTVSAVEARQHLGEILESVSRGDEIVIERAGKAMAVFIPPTRYAALERSRERLWEMIEEVHEQNKDVAPDVIEREIEEAIREVRAHAARERQGHRKAG